MKYLTTKIGTLRLTSFLEGISLLLLIGIAVPMKYFGDDPRLVQSLGPIHGFLFLLFVVLIAYVSIEDKWAVKDTILLVLIASFIPFGTFYVDRKIVQQANSSR